MFVIRYRGFAARLLRQARLPSPGKSVSAGGYQLLRPGRLCATKSSAVADKSARDLQRRGVFALLPDRVRHLGLWQGLTGGEIDGLKLHYRLQLAEQGFVLVYQQLANFSAEKSPTI